MKNPWVIIGIIVVVLVGASIWYAGQVAEQNNEGITLTENIKGNPEASVRLVEYSDFQCPACASFQPVLTELMEAYGDQLVLEYRHFPLPFHQASRPAARAAEAAGQQGKFFEYHDMLFERQDEWSGSVNPSAQFFSYAEELELDMPTFRRHFNASLIRDHVNAQYLEGQERGVNATPSFFLNGERVDTTREGYTFQTFFDEIASAVDPDYVSPTATENLDADAIRAELEGQSAATGTAPAATGGSEVRFGL